MIVIDDLTGQILPSQDVSFVNAVMESRNKHGIWETIDLLIKQWVQSNPVKYDSFLVEAKAKQDSRSNRFGSNKAHTLRSLVDFPQPVHDRIRAVYKADELPFDKEFFNKFWKRYPQFRIAEKL